jgi:hypothetical protein
MTNTTTTNAEQIAADMKACEGRRDWMYYLQDVDRMYGSKARKQLGWEVYRHHFALPTVRVRRLFLEGVSVRDAVGTLIAEVQTQA